MGFQHFYDIYEMNLPEAGWGASDGDFLNYVGKKIQVQAQPFCSYLITMSSHGPFLNIRKNYNDSTLNDIADHVTRNYCNAISYVSMQLDKFISSIYSKIPNTIVFIFGDHPANVPELALNSSSMTYKDYAFNFVPLIIITPDSLRHLDSNSCATNLDIAPTILSATVGGSIRTRGVNLLDTTVNLSNQYIVMDNKSYSRSDLKKIVSILKEQKNGTRGGEEY
jgi:lipoteichoic acid synthase